MLEKILFSRWLDWVLGIMAAFCVVMLVATLGHGLGFW